MEGEQARRPEQRSRACGPSSRVVRVTSTEVSKTSGREKEDRVLVGETGLFWPR